MEFFIQAGLYVSGYLLTNAAVLIGHLHFVAAKREPGFVIHSIAAATFPLGGVFNILIYTRPKVILFRKQHPRYSWIRALVLVIKSGCVVPMVPVEKINEIPSFESQEWIGFRSVITADFGLENALSSAGIIDMGHDKDGQQTERQYYGEIVAAVLKMPLRSENCKNELPQSQVEHHQHRKSFPLFSEMYTIEEEKIEI